jgi:hypothetical protein
MPTEGTTERQPDRLTQKAAAHAEQTYADALRGKGEWQMTLAEASRLSGISIAMLRFFLRRGELEATLIHAKRPYYLVNVQSLVDIARTKTPATKKRTGRPRSRPAVPS